MKMKYFILPLAAFVLTVSSCESKKEEAVSQSASTDTIVKSDSIPSGDTSKVSVDWEGTYEGVLPCADCEGIKTTILLNEDETYKFSSEYLGKNYKSDESGKFTWSADGNDITIKFKDGESTSYVVGENQLVQLDQEGKQITGVLADKYVLKKK